MQHRQRQGRRLPAGLWRCLGRHNWRRFRSWIVMKQVHRSIGGAVARRLTIGRGRQLRRRSIAIRFMPWMPLESRILPYSISLKEIFARFAVRNIPEEATGLYFLSATLSAEIGTRVESLRNFNRRLKFNYNFFYIYGGSINDAP